MENNEVKQIRFDKSKLYAINGLSINQKIDANVSLHNVEGKRLLTIFYEHMQRKKIWPGTKNL